MISLIRRLSLLVLIFSAFTALMYLFTGLSSKESSATAQGQIAPTRNKYGITLPDRYRRVEDGVVAAAPYAMGGHRGTMFYLANGKTQYSSLKFGEATRLLARESCGCFLDTGKGVANTLYIPDPCEQYQALRQRCRNQQKPELRLSSEIGFFKLGIHCTKIEALIIHCPVR